MEENTNVELQNESVSRPSAPSPKPVSNDRASPVAHATPKVVREAEHKLKEMSRKAKERKTAHNTSKHPRGLSEINYFYLVLGGLGALGVGYLVFGTKDREPSKPRQRFKFVPKQKTPEKVSVNEEIKKEEKEGPKFELNCF